jgi:hypothetical protein
MAWFKRNLYVMIVVVLAVCAVGALALQAAQGGTAAGSAAPGTTAPEQTDRPVTGADFQNRNEAASELVKSWVDKSRLNSYELALVLDPDKKTMTGTMDFTYVNTEDRPMNELHFLLYANSHEKQQYGIFEGDDMEAAYPNGFSPGSIEIESVTSDSGKVQYLVTGEQEHVLEVRLPKDVAVGQTIRLTIEYTVVIPNCYGRFGYGDDTMSLVNCNPILSVYDAGEWFDYPYYEIGDPFYSETADFKATIETPSDWTVAATGVLTQKTDGGQTVWTVDAPGRRDFGFVASDKFEVMQTESDGVLVRSYYVKGSKSRGRAALETGAEAIALYSEAFGPYPFAEFSVVETDFFIGGMEYPGMVLIDHSMYNAMYDRMTFDLVVAHETGHQWWYSVVGDNEVTEPWLDEGMTEFTTQYFFEKERDASYNNFYRQYSGYMLDTREGQEGKYAVTLPVYAFDDGLTYSAWVYDRTAAVLMDLREKIGDDKFFAAMKAYYADNRLGVATREDLEKAFEDASGTELTQWFEEEFKSSGN